MTEHHARITWSSQHVAAGLPDTTETVDPAWLGARTPEAEGWSLVCRFDSSPRAQGNPTTAVVRFLVPAAPHAALQPGTRLQLFERGTGQYADVEILG
jgi:hypothetical protein